MMRMDLQQFGDEDLEEDRRNEKTQYDTDAPDDPPSPAVLPMTPDPALDIKHEAHPAPRNAENLEPVTRHQRIAP